MHFIKKIFFLTDKKKSDFISISFLLTISSLLEVLGIGIIVSFVSLMLGVNNGIENKINDLINAYIPNFNVSEPLFFIGYSFIVIFLIKTLIVFAVNYKIEKFSRIVEFNLKERLLKNFIFLPDALYSKQNISKKIETIVRLTQIFQGPCLVSLLKFSSTLIQFFAIFILLLFTNLIMTITICVLLVTITFLYTQLIKPYAKKYIQEESVASKNLIQSIYEISDGISELKIYNKTEFFFKRFLNHTKKVFENSLKSSILFFIIKPSLELIVVILFVTTTLILKYNQVIFENYFSTFTIFVLSFLRLLPISTESISSLNRVISSKYAVDTIYDEIINLEVNEKKIKDSFGDKFFFESIHFENVKFHYDTRKTIINGINFKIEKNSFTGISGRSGSGKTTLVNLIMGKLVQSEGSIKINDTDNKLNIHSFQNRVSYIQQNPFIFEGTLKENICISKDINYKKFLDSLAQSELLDFYNENKDKSFGDRGIQLSGGQRQRIAIARAFYHDRNILILDEFTNQLDYQTEKNILDYVKSLKKIKTIILITHNREILERCDQVINL